MEFLLFETHLGCMALGEEEGHITRLYLPNPPTPRLMPHETPLLSRAREQLLEYLAGERKKFDLPLAPQGTPFQQKVWAALRAIPYGQVCSYKDLARSAGCPRGFQAVGQANRRNPIPILIPCHRVIAADGSAGGYGGGSELKRALLAIEGVCLPWGEENFLSRLAK